MSTGDVPADLRAALAADAVAERAFAALPPSHRSAYLKWIGEAKRAETRARRIAETVGRVKGKKEGLLF